ncbi:D-3-phosphoglycerate dehydrogenase [Plakobranchus ocellatus]|uniref:D-3-phosphoglycerate dehydrogenase n=1 Tax=Plakobranchus ocellatus TaxID=259542 RepID=A0AAV3YD17_9GAST|nr:D-3-phosphoglycerate dehydrogenase [Plakobranchus ocellatus]
MVMELRKVLISDEVDEKCVDILHSNGISVTKNTKLSKSELLQIIPEYDGLIVRSATKVTAEVINAGKNLKIIGRAGTGVDNIDTEAATRNGVIVMNTPGGNTLSAAEHTCTLIIALTRNLGAASMSMKEGKWDRKAFMGSELYGKTLGIIGLGRIGKEVATRMQAFGMRTIGFDPIVKPEECAEWDTKWMSLDDLWPQADYITVHTPLIPQTKHLLNDTTFAKCKKGVRVVNCARGGIIDEAALLRALESGQCAGAGLDVFAEEPPKDYTLVKHPKVVATPHLGANTVEAQTRVAEDIAQQFVDLVQGKSLFGAINAHALTNALSPSTQPWVKLGESLGVLGSLLTKTLSVVNLEVILYGSELKDAGAYMAASVMVGYLRTTRVDNGDLLPYAPNMVNAPVLTKQAGMIHHNNGQDGESAQLTNQLNLVNAPVLAKQKGIVGTKCSVIYREIVENHGEQAMSMTQVYQWCSWFKEGRTSLQDEPRSGRPNTANNDWSTA